MGVRILAHAPMLALLLLCSILHVRGALQDYDEDPWVEAKSSKKMIVRWQKQNTGCGAMSYRLFYRIGGSVKASNDDALSLTANAWTAVSGDVTTDVDGGNNGANWEKEVDVVGCGACYEFRIQADCEQSGSHTTNCDSGSKCGPESDAICSPACISGVSGEQCGVRSDGTYRCTPASAVSSATDLASMFYQTTATTSDAKIVKAFLNIDFTSATADMWKEPGFANGFSKAYGETLGELTNMPWLNASVFVGNIYLCSDAGNGNSQGCLLGSGSTGVSIEALADCGTNTDCVTNVKAAYLMLSNTDPTTQITYANDFMYRLLYYMTQDTYDYLNLAEDTTYSTSYANYNQLGFADMSLYVPTVAATESAVNPLTDTWMPQEATGSTKVTAGWQSFEYPCGITQAGTAECLGYYENWANGSYKVTKQVAPRFRQRKFKMLSSDAMRTCGITHNDRLICWGYEDLGTYTVGSLVFPCGWTKNIVAKARVKEYEMELNRNNGNEAGKFTKVKLKWRWKHVSVGGGGTNAGTVCGVRQDGKGFCFGCNEALGADGNLQDEMPDDFEWQKIEVSKDAKWAVGWAEDGQARAWGQKGEHPEIPEDIRFRDIPSIMGSTNHVVCGLQQADGKLLCFGHYKDTNNKYFEISRSFQAASNPWSVAAGIGMTDTSAGWAYSATTNSGQDVRGFRTLSKWGCGDYYGTSSGTAYNSADCVQMWDGWDGVGTTASCTNVAASYSDMTAGSTDFKFVVAPGVPYSTATDDDDLVATASTDGKQATITFMTPYATSADGQKAIAGYQVYVKGGKRRRRRRAGKWKMKWMVADAHNVDTNSVSKSITITGLQPDEKYKFRLRAFSTEGGYAFGRWSEDSNSIYTPKGTPNQIQHFWWEASRSADDYLFLNWYTPESNGLDYDVTYFQVKYKVSSASAYTTADIYPRTNQDINEPWAFVEEWLNGLSAATTYAINVAACNSNGCGTATSDISATTNSSVYEVAYSVKTNITFVAQWCFTNTDCGNWITTGTWSSDIQNCFISSIIYWLQWHSTYFIEYTYAHEGYSAYAPTPAPSSGAISPTILADLGDGLTVEDQDDWEDTTTEDCSGGPSTGCYQPTTMPTNKPIEEISNDGYYNDPGALNGSDTGDKTLTNDNVTINGETDFTYDDQDTSNPTPTPTPEPGTNVDYQVDTGNEDQADTTLQVVTENEEGNAGNEDGTQTFSTTFTDQASSQYSAYTGSSTHDSVNGAYEAEQDNTDTTGYWIALLAAVVVILCLLAFILHGWYKRHQLKKYLARRARVQSKFQKATATIGQMRRLGKLTAILKVDENAFSYKNLTDQQKNRAENLLRDVQTSQDSTQKIHFDQEEELRRLKEMVEKGEDYRNASAAQQRRIMQEKLDRRKAELRARQQGSVATDAAVRERLEDIVAETATDKNYAIIRLNSDDNEDLDRVMEELKRSEAYQRAQALEQKEMMERRLAERRKELIEMREKQAREKGEQILDPEVVDQILERASSALVQQLQADAFDEEAELARLRAEVEASDEFSQKQAADQRAFMMEKLDARKSAIRARQQAAREAKQDRDELAEAQGLSSEEVPKNEVALIIAKVEENVIDACDANSEAAKILADFNVAETDRERHSAEARMLKKKALQKRLADRREAAIAAQAAAMQEANPDLDQDSALEQAGEAMQLSEKWQDVEDDLVEQALSAYEVDLHMQSDAGNTIDDKAQEAALARVMWQLHRDIAHAEELRNNEWASSEAANILKRYEQASKAHEADVKEAQTEAKLRLEAKLEKRRALRLKKPPKTNKGAMWKRVTSDQVLRRVNRIWHELERTNTSENLNTSYNMEI